MKLNTIYQGTLLGSLCHPCPSISDISTSSCLEVLYHTYPYISPATSPTSISTSTYPLYPMMTLTLYRIYNDKSTTTYSTSSPLLSHVPYLNASLSSQIEA